MTAQAAAGMQASPGDVPYPGAGPATPVSDACGSDHHLLLGGISSR